MREIKFRAWVNSYSHWHMTDKINISNTGVFFHVGQSNITNPDWKLMQFTGLKDKNGEEIYEGDIALENIHYTDGKTKTTTRIVEEDICNPCFVMRNIVQKDDIEYDFIKCGTSELEIIGNIYENPELLEVSR